MSELAGTSSLARPVPPPVAETVAERLRVLGQPVRVRLIERLDGLGELTVGALAKALGERLHNVSRHLALLRAAGVVTRRHHGREVFYQLADSGAMLVYELVAAGLLAEAARRSKLIEPPG